MRSNEFSKTHRSQDFGDAKFLMSGINGHLGISLGSALVIVGCWLKVLCNSSGEKGAAGSGGKEG